LNSTKILTNVSSDSPSPRPLPASLHAMLHSPREPELSDPRLGATRRWTSVTDNADFLSLIMSAWYKWEYSYHHFLDWDTFLDDLSDGKNDFCSEFLVNAVLASGCVSDFTRRFIQAKSFTLIHD
jgi:hypothetical protein